MITPEDVVLHLGTYLPRVTDLFSITRTVTSAEVLSADTIQIVSSNHGLSVSDAIAISGGLVHTPITISQLEGTTQVKFTTNIDHDFTSPSVPPNFEVTATFAEFTNSLYNTIQTIQNVPNRRNLIIDLPSGETVAPTLNGNEYVIEDRNLGIKGFHTVTSVIDTNTFTVQILGIPDLPINPITNLTMLTNVRVTAAADIERARKIYTKQTTNSTWIFVIMGTVDISKDRHTLNDATAGFTAQDFQVLRFLQNFSTVVFVPTQDDVSGSAAQNLIYNDIFRDLNKVLFGYGFNDPDSVIPYVTVTDGHGPNSPYKTAWYEQVFNWQLPFATNFEAGFDQQPDVAFRDINSTWDNNSDTAAQLILNIDLDEDPL